MIEPALRKQINFFKKFRERLINGCHYEVLFCPKKKYVFLFSKLSPKECSKCKFNQINNGECNPICNKNKNK